MIELTEAYRETVDELVRLNKLKKTTQDAKGLDSISAQLSGKLQRLFTISQQLESGVLTEEKLNNLEMNEQVIEKIGLMERGFEELKTMIGSRVPEIKVQLDSIHIQEAGIKHIEERFDERFQVMDSKIQMVHDRIEEKANDVIENFNHSKMAYLGMVKMIKEEVVGLLTKVSNENDANTKLLINAINEIEFAPNITVEANTDDILAELISIRNELLASNSGIEVTIEKVLDKLNEKHKWQLTVQRNSDKLITGAVATEI